MAVAGLSPAGKGPEAPVPAWVTAVAAEPGQAADGQLRLHAGVVAWRGRAIVLPGDSGAGKSTLVSALVARGAELLADDVALFDGDRRVLASPASGPPRAWGVGAVVFTRWSAGGRFEPRPLRPGHAALALLRHVMTPRLAGLLPDLARLSSSACCLAGPRGDAGGAAEGLLARLEEVW